MHDTYAPWTDEEVLRVAYRESTNPLVQTLARRLAEKIDELGELRDRLHEARKRSLI